MNARRLMITVVSALVLSMMQGSTIAAQVGKPVTVMDANRACEKELASVPHLTPALVRNIVDRRPFRSVTDLNGVLAAR